MEMSFSNFAFELRREKRKQCDKLSFCQNYATELEDIVGQECVE
jgi:hypothetical protein